MPFSFPTTMDFIPGDDEIPRCTKTSRKKEIKLFKRIAVIHPNSVFRATTGDNVPIIEDKKIPFDINDKCAYRVPFDEHKGDDLEL